ncbi:hypothetical protein Bca52824_023977 [Brassica carinata]|uniref:S12 n=1 Tax=Brassica carinata TaxID=52824 RepID=A0A8X7VK93_BRACI|nr:hypothetical protein Bca52824_023977 [Brassica carinata]
MTGLCESQEVWDLHVFKKYIGKTEVVRQELQEGSPRKYKPLAGVSHAKGIVLELIGMEAKQPNFGICKCARIQLVKNGKKVAAFVPNDGCLNLLKPNDEVLVSGFGRKGHALGDIPGVRYKVVKVSGV